MAGTSFESRLQRIHDSHEICAAGPPQGVPANASVPPLEVRRTRVRTPLQGHAQTVMFGILLGALAALLLVGLTLEGVPWGPGTGLYDLFYWPSMAGLTLAPFLILTSVFVAGRRPGYAVFSLGYLTGMSLFFVI